MPARPVSGRPKASIALPRCGHCHSPRLTSAEACDSRFIAFLGADVYQFSPTLPGDLGTVRLFTVLSYQGAAADQEFGRALWHLEIRGPVGVAERLVRSAAGAVTIDSAGRATAQLRLDGRDGAACPRRRGPIATASAAGSSPTTWLRAGAASYEELARVAGVVEA